MGLKSVVMVLKVTSPGRWNADFNEEIFPKIIEMKQVLSSQGNIKSFLNNYSKNEVITVVSKLLIK